MHSSHESINEMIKNIEDVLFSNPFEAKSRIAELLDVSTSINNAYGLLKANNMMGILASEAGHISEALDYYSVAMSFTIDAALENEKPIILNNIGTSQIISHQFFEAIVNLTNALKYILENRVQMDMLFTIYLNIADAYLNIHQPDEAIKILNESIAYQDLEDLEGQALLMGSYAEAYLQLNDNKAYEWILLCEEMVDQVDYAMMRTLVNYYKAKYYEMNQATKEADSFFNLALSSHLEGDSFYHYSKIALDYIAFMLAHLKFEKALPFIKTAIEIVKKNNWEWAYLEYYRYLSECYRQLGDFNSAFQAVEEYFNIVSMEKLKRNRKNYDFFKVQEKVLHINLQNKTLSDSVNQLKTMNNVLKTINQANDIQRMIEIVYELLGELFSLDTFGLAVYNDEQEMIQYINRYENGYAMGPSQIHFQSPKSFSAWVWAHQKPLIIHDVSDFEAIKANYSGIKVDAKDFNHDGNVSKTIVIWPMSIEARVVGLINIQALEKHAFTTIDLELIEMIASHLAISIENFRQKTDLNDAIERLNRMTFIDSLTGVYNRQALNEFLPKLYSKAISDSTQLVFAMIDLDNFKQLNDQFGHQEGDRCLVEFAELLRSVIGELGYIYRYGGDEFSLLFIGIELEVVESMIIEVITRAQTFYDLSEVIRMSASVGGIFVDNAGLMDLSLNTFINYADNALYIAKNEGKNQFKKVIL